MTRRDKNIAERDKILRGLEIAYEKLLVFKRQKGSELVIIKNNEIVRIKP